MTSFELVLKKRKIIRYSCLVLGIIIIFYTSYKLTQNTNHLLEENSVDLSTTDNNSKDFSLEVNKPIFEGVNNNNQPYKITAYNVSKNIDIYFLDEVQGEYYLSADNKITFFSKHGSFDDNAKDLHLKDSVIIKYGIIEFQGRDVNINVRDKTFNTYNPIKILGEDSYIEANSLSLPKNSQIIELKGKVAAIISLQSL
ncbi:MAG: LPS export ABC transporter periplasmic protein LptC [Rickettsiaceae bacterium]|nr:LPS export ABC transporter periplasmic protein LptC [Rickettsiaceae bacterium]